MPSDYKNIKHKKPAKPLTERLTERFGNTLSFMTGLTLGLFVAVVVYFNEHNTTIETNNTLLDNRKNISEKNEKVQQPPEPTFDFYKILPNREINISEWETAKEEMVQTKQEPALFVFQVGSFEQYSEADRIKARLALIGVIAKIQRVVINGQKVHYRVRIGPYKNDDDRLQQTRQHLLTNNLKFMLLKLKMEDT